MAPALLSYVGEELMLDPTRTLACSLLIVALALGSADGCNGGSPPKAGQQPINYTFDTGPEGWAVATNFGAAVPDGGSQPTLGFVATDGDPEPGALRLTAAFTGSDQIVEAWVSVAPDVQGGGDRDLSGKTLHARFRLVSGAAVGVKAALVACSVHYLFGCTTGPSTDAAQLPAGAWVPLVTDGSSNVGVLEVWFYTPTTAPDGGADDGGAFASTGDLVFDIDTVTE